MLMKNDSQWNNQLGNDASNWIDIIIFIYLNINCLCQQHKLTVALKKFLGLHSWAFGIILSCRKSAEKSCLSHCNFNDLWWGRPGPHPSAQYIREYVKQSRKSYYFDPKRHIEHAILLLWFRKLSFIAAFKNMFNCYAPRNNRLNESASPAHTPLAGANETGQKNALAGR